MKIDIKNKLDEKGISRYELAQRIGVTYPTITSIYKGESTSVKFDILEAICKELNCSLDEILIFDDTNMKERQMKRLLAYSTMLRENKNKSDTEYFF